MKTETSPTIERHSAPLEPESFSDTLYHWMERAPWLAISGAFHLVAFLILAAIPWSIFEQPEERVVHVGVDHVPEPEILEPEEPEEPVEPEPAEPKPGAPAEMPKRSAPTWMPSHRTPGGAPINVAVEVCVGPGAAWRVRGGRRE